MSFKESLLMKKKCSFCGNKNLTKKTTCYIHQSKDELLIIEDAPCIECNFCGEQYFDAYVLKAIEAEHLAILNHQKMPQVLKSVAIESFSDMNFL